MLATITGTGDGTAPVVTLTFPYLDKEHVKASVDGVDVAATWTGTSQVTFVSPVPAGAAWKVYRDTPTSPPVVDFTGGAVITEADLDTANLAHAYRDEELADILSVQELELGDHASEISAETAAREAADAALSANILAIPKGDPGSAGEGYPSRAALAAAPATHLDDAYLTEPGREGKFIASTADLSSAIAADPQQGVYIPGNGVTWVRDLNGKVLTPYHFGAKGDGVTDDIVALQAFWDSVVANSYPHDGSINSGVSSRLTIGPAALPTEVPPRALNGRIRLHALAPMNEVVRLKNLAYRRWHGGIWAHGIGGASFASRTCLIGTYVENCSRLEITDGLFGENFALANVYLGTANNNMMKIGGITGSNIGSGQVGNSLTANWSAPVNSGGSGSTSQRTTISLDAFPSAAIQSYEAIGTSPVQVRIAGYPYYVYSVDQVAGTATIYPWLDNASFAAGSGTLEWIFGANLATRSSDSNLVRVSRLDGSSVGRNLSDGVLYGSIIDNMQTNGAGTEIQIGNYPSAAGTGTTVLGRYNEGGSASSEQIVVINSFGASNFHQFFGDTGAPDLAKCWAVSAPRSTAGGIIGGEFGSNGTGFGSVSMTKLGRLLPFHKLNVSHALSSDTLTGQARPPIPAVYFSNSFTATLSVQGSGEYNRLFGYSGGLVGFFGTGANGQPTGNITFVPPPGGTINGGAVGASVVFSGLTGPAYFMYEHTDTAQLTWQVRQLTGQFSKAATSSATYVAPSGGTTIDTQARTSLAQLAADLADMKTKLQAAKQMT